MDSFIHILVVPLIFSCTFFPFLWPTSLGTILFTGGSILNYVFGILVIVVSLYNVLIIFIHPAFKKGGMKITDDPTQNYTAGESVAEYTMLYP